VHRRVLRHDGALIGANKMTDNDPHSTAGAAGFRESSHVGDAVAAAIGEFVRLVLQHWKLAGAEWADSSAGFAAAALLTTAALLVGFIALMLLLTGAALTLALIVPIWLSFLAVGATVMAAAGALFIIARM
jgi:hypothetical protein